MADWRSKRAIIEQRDQARTAAKQILDNAQSARRGLTGDERARFEGLKAQIGEFQAAIERHEVVDALVDSPRPFTRKDLERYSLVRAIRARAAHRDIDGLEAEVSQEIAYRTGRSPDGFYVPLELPIERRDGVLTAALGGGMNGVSVATDIIGMLRARAVLSVLGATVYDGLAGTFSLPKQTAATSFTWVADATAADLSNATTAQLPMTPKRLIGATGYSKTLLAQNANSIEMFVRGDLAVGLALALDLAAINGSGEGANPKGLLQHSTEDGIAELALGANGEALDWSDIIAMQLAVAAKDADLASTGWLTNAKVRAKLQGTPKVNGLDAFIWNDDNRIAGQQAQVSSQMPGNLTKGASSEICSAMIYGAWSSCAVGLWAASDLVVNPITEAGKGLVMVTMNQFADIQFRHLQSFCRTVDVLT